MHGQPHISLKLAEKYETKIVLHLFLNMVNRNEFLTAMHWCGIGPVAQSVYRLSTGWTVRVRIPVGTGFFVPVHTGTGAHPDSCTMGTGSFPGGKVRPGRDAEPSPLLVPWSGKSRAMLVLPLWAVRPVQGVLYFYQGRTRGFRFTTNWINGGKWPKETQKKTHNRLWKKRWRRFRRKEKMNGTE